MTAWAQSLIRISNYEVETLQKRLAEIAARRATAEMRIAVLDAEAENERDRARLDPDAGMMLAAYLHGWKSRKAVAEGDLTNLERVIRHGDKRGRVDFIVSPPDPHGHRGIAWFRPVDKENAMDDSRIRVEMGRTCTVGSFRRRKNAIAPCLAPQVGLLAIR